MGNNTAYEKKSEDTALNVVSAKLCFENLSNKYKPGYLIVEGNIANERNKALHELASFASVIVDDVAVNESNSKSTIYVSTVVSSEDDKQKLYEWIKKYAGKDNVDSIAPGLLESVKEDSVSEDNSVASRFAKYRKLYEEEMIEDDEVSEDEEEETSDDNKEDDNKEETSDDNKEDDNKEDGSEEEEQDELTAIIIEVKKGDEDKAKDELIEAGVDEDDIEILDNEEEEDKEENEEEEESDKDDKEETVKIKIAVDSFDALKEYLEGKGFNLEDELGGEIVTDDNEEGGDEEGGDDNGESMDDAFAGFDDLFADTDDSSEEDDK